MSWSEELLKFQEMLKNDPEKLKAYDEAVEKLTKEKSVVLEAEAAQKAAKELGYELSIEELTRVFAEKQDLDDDELDEVAGGWEGCKRSSKSPMLL